MSNVYRHSDGSWRDYAELATYEPSAVMLVEPGKNYTVTVANTNDIHTNDTLNQNKGIRYNKGKLRWRNFPMFLMEPLVKVGSANEKHEGNPSGKYPTHNFLNGLKVNDTLDSLHRHLCDFTDPLKPDVDTEDNVHHLAKIAWNALVALYYIENKPEWDDRTLKHDKNI